MSKKEKNIKQEDIKIVLVGESGVGKTALMNKYNSNTFDEVIDSTLSSSFITKEINIRGKNIILKVWDTAGQEKYRSLSKIFLKNAKIIVLVYDITSKSSFVELNFWYNLAKSELGEKIILGLIANKSDLFENEEVRTKEGKELAQNWGAVFSLLSAKLDKQLIDNFFIELTKKYLEIKFEEEWEIIDEIQTFKITEKTEISTFEKEDKKCFGGGKSIKEKNINIAFLGPNGVGKTNIINIIRNKTIEKEYIHTQKINRIKMNYSLEKKKKINLILIDTNGDDCNDLDMDMILKECKIIFFVFELNNRNTFEKLKILVNKISENKKNIKYLGIIGNKTNLLNIDIVTNEEAEEFSKKNEANFIPISFEDISKLQEVIKYNVENYME